MLTNLVEIIDPKRAKSMAIMIQSRFKKMSFEEMKDGIIALDEELFSPADIISLSMNSPAPEEV
jgi:hypothetical protein